MKKKKKIIVLTLLCICVAFVASRFSFETSAKKGQVVGCDIETNYKYGDTFVMPAGKVSYKGVEKEAESKYVVFPSGKANESDEIVLSEDGKYEVVYKAEFDGVAVSAKKSFIVNKRLLSVSSEKSSAELVDNKINVSLVPSDTFTYNEAMDLSGATIEKPLINVAFQPNIVGTADALRLKFRFTDLYDEENYMTITVKNVAESWADGVVYLTAGAANQPQIGLENLEDPLNTRVHINNTVGAAAYCSMVGRPNSSLDTQLKIYLDYKERAIYVDREVYSGGQNRMVIDLDEGEYFGNNIWNGFTTGEVKLSITAENYQSTDCNFILSEINGQTEFRAEGDQESPVITVDPGYEMDELPNALVGKSYKAFPVHAFDKYDGEVEVVTSAYYKYYSENPVKLPVTDGAFTPNKEGVYVIEYMATDSSGNVAKECVKINAVDGDGLQVELKDIAKETYTGVAVKVVSGVSYKDNSGNVGYSVIAKNKDTEEEVEINRKTLEFCPMSDGDWEITVTVNDYVSTVKKSFYITSNHTSQPQVYGNTSLQKYFILGAKYHMPSLSGYDFSSGTGVLTDMDIFVTEKGSKEKQLTDKQYVPEKKGDVKITYRLIVDGMVCEKSYSATIVDVGYGKDLNLGKYFVATKGKVKAQTETTSITYNTDGNAKLDFVNFVQVKNLKFSFKVGEKNAYKKVHIYLTDTLTGKQVKFSYRRAKEGALFSMNDGAEFAVASSFDGMDRNFALEFNNDTHMVSAATSLSLTVERFLDGSSFEGFTDSQAFFTVEMEDVSGASELVINNLNSQSLNNARIDRFAPEIIVETKSGDRGVGEEVKLTGAFVYDTLDPISTLSLAVTDPNGKFVKDSDGVVLDGTQDPTKDYTVKLAEYGDYTIAYTATDGTGKTEEYVYAITSKDVTGPTITLKKHKASAKVGDNVALAKAEVVDDVTEKCTVTAYTFDPEGVVVQVKDDKFKATMAGTYTVRYMAFDESGNCAFASYEIDVK